MDRFGRRLAALAAAGLALRLAYLALLAPDLGGGASFFGLGDWVFYHQQANLIADGHGFIDPAAWQADGAERPSADHPPLWPLVLAVASAMGGTGWTAHRVVSCLVGAVVVALAGLLGRRVGGERVGLVSAALAAVHPLLIAADASVMSESLYAALVLAALLAAHRLATGGGPRSALALGALLGLAALARTEALLLLPLLALPAALFSGPGARPRALAVGAVTLAFALVLAPWLIRNQATFDEGVLIATNDASVLAGANCPKAWRGADKGGWAVECVLGTAAEQPYGERAKAWRRRGLDYARDNLGSLPGVMAARVLRTWDLKIPRRQAAFAVDRHRRVQEAGVLLFYVLFALAVAGVVLIRRDRAALLVVLAPILAVTLASALGYGSSRFRHAAEVPLTVLASVALVRGAAAARPASRPRRVSPTR